MFLMRLLEPQAATVYPPDRAQRPQVVRDAVPLLHLGRRHHGDRVDGDELQAVWAAVRIISETVGSLPTVLYRLAEIRGKDEASDSGKSYPLMHEWNSEATAIVAQESCQRTA